MWLRRAITVTKKRVGTRGFRPSEEPRRHCRQAVLELVSELNAPGPRRRQPHGLRANGRIIEAEVEIDLVSEVLAVE